jgi:hypothetical protein
MTIVLAFRNVASQILQLIIEFGNATVQLVQSALHCKALLFRENLLSYVTLSKFP